MSAAICNRRRGETIAIIGGEPVKLCLTLGALAELESAFDVADLGGLAARFARGSLSSRDILAIVTVAMRGAGRNITDAEAAALPVAGELPGLAAAVADLLALTFGAPEDGAGNRTGHRTGEGAGDAAVAEAGAALPFASRTRPWGKILDKILGKIIPRLLRWLRLLFPGTR